MASKKKQKKANGGAPAIENAETADPPKLEITTSRQFNAWLAEQSLGLAFTTYQAGKLFLLGLRADGRLSIEERTVARCMGMVAQGDSLWVSSLHQIWRFENVVPPDRHRPSTATARQPHETLGRLRHRRRAS